LPVGMQRGGNGALEVYFGFLGDNADVSPEQQPDVSEPRARRYAGKTLEERRGDQWERLIAAARDVFAREGYAAAGLDDIVSAARVSRTSFYTFFANKEECLLAVVQAGTERINEALMQVIAKPLEPAERIRAEITVLAQGFAADPAMARVILIEAVGATPAVERVRAEARQAAADLIEAQLREYPVWRDRPEERAVVALVAAYVARGLAAGGELSSF
jgi:AcrR family transcriptional regulator